MAIVGGSRRYFGPGSRCLRRSRRDLQMGVRVARIPFWMGWTRETATLGEGDRRVGELSTIQDMNEGSGGRAANAERETK